MPILPSEEKADGFTPAKKGEAFFFVEYAESNSRMPMRRLSTGKRACSANGDFQTSNNSTYIFLSKIHTRQIIPVKLFYRGLLSRADAAR